MNTFLLETFNRLFKSKSPAFFIRMRIVFGFFTFANYIPTILMRYFNVDVPSNFMHLCEDVAKYSTGIFAALFLPAAEPPAAQTVDGVKVQVTNVEKYPFSAKKEMKKIEETIPPPPVIEPGTIDMPEDEKK